MKITYKDLKKKYLEFFKEKGHAVIPSYSLVPENDPGSGLFILAGMHPLIPYLMGQPHPMGTRLVDCQKCIRTNDIDDVGDKTHNTFFEMLGNWSLGDYFKKEAIAWSYEFLTDEKWLGLEKEKLWVTVFKGENGVPKDEEAEQTWLSMGLPKERIIPLGMKDNWWAAGSEGPCGPDTEMFIDMTGKPCAAGENCKPGNDCCQRFFEIWNNVFMAYNRKKDGTLERLPKQNVDTGMGVERTLAALGGYESIYDTPVLKPILDALRERAENKDEHALRIMTDHLRTAVMILADDHKIAPSNIGSGYVLRRIIRRSLRMCQKTGVAAKDWIETAEGVKNIYADYYDEVARNIAHVKEALMKENNRFEQTLKKGEHFFEKAVENLGGKREIDGGTAFTLYDTYGFPIEMTLEMAKEKGLTVDVKGYEEAFEKHRAASKTAENAKSGLTENSEQTVRYHTATHLLHAALRSVLGAHVQQKGSNITSERIRFDFSHPQAMTKEEIEKVEAWVQDKIDREIPVVCENMSLAEAEKTDALGLFKSKYDTSVSVYTIPGASMEICAGPHVKNTGEMKGRFKIQKEQSAAAGIRRIKAVIE